MFINLLAMSSSLHGKLTLCLKRAYHWKIFFFDKSIPVLPPSFLAKCKKSKLCVSKLEYFLKKFSLKKYNLIF